MSRVCVGVIAGVRGLSGDVWIKSFTANPEDVAAYGPVSDQTGERLFRIRVVGQAKGRVVARIDGIADRTAAEALKGEKLYVPRDALPAPDEDEYYHADLIGLRAVLAGGDGPTEGGGGDLGRVRAVHEFGAGTVIEIEGPASGVHMVPFTREAVPVVDVAAGRLEVAPIAGLIDPVSDHESGAGGGQDERWRCQVTDAVPWIARVMTLFPEMFPGSVAHSLAGQALSDGKWVLETVDIRAFARDKHRTVDDTPFGGGPGMVMRPDVVDAAIAAAICDKPDLPLIFLTPRGRTLKQARVRALSEGNGVALLCGRFEGVDERVLEAWAPEEISLGDFVLSGGEPAAVALIDACVRLLPGVVGDPGSLAEESFERELLEYPHYTRPRAWRERDVPEVLLSGNHGMIDTWRRRRAEEITRERRPDLWARHVADQPEAAGRTTTGRRQDIVTGEPGPVCSVPYERPGSK